MKLNNVIIRLLKIVRIILIIICVCIAFGCYMKQVFFSKELSYQETTDEGVSSQSELIVNKKYIGDIPVIEYYNETTGMENKPIIIIEYGVTGKKEEMQEIAKAYAGIGCFVVTPDLYLHGERIEESKCSLLEIAVHSSGEIEEILNYYSSSTIVDMDRIGLIGYSLGGMTVYHYLANGTYPVKTVGILCSTPDWVGLQDNVAIYKGYSKGKLIDISEERYEEIAEYATENSPYDVLIKKMGISYGLISGGQDKVLSCEGTEKFYSEYVANGGAAVYQRNDELGHEIGMEELLNIYYFFTSNL